MEEAISGTRKKNGHEHVAKVTLQRAIELKKARDLQSERECAEKRSAEAEQLAREANAARLNALLAAARERSSIKREEFDKLAPPDTLKGHGFDLSALSALPDNIPECAPSGQLLIGGPPQKSVAENETMDRHKSFLAFDQKFISRAVITIIFVVVAMGAYLHVDGDGTADNAPDAMTSPEQSTAAEAALSETKQLRDAKPAIAVDRQTPQPPVSAPVIAVEPATPSRSATTVAPMALSNPQEAVPAASTQPPPLPKSASTQTLVSAMAPDKPMVVPTRSGDVTLIRQVAGPKAKALNLTDTTMALRQNVTVPAVPARNPIRIQELKAPLPLPPDLPSAYHDVE